MSDVNVGAERADGGVLGLSVGSDHSWTAVQRPHRSLSIHCVAFLTV